MRRLLVIAAIVASTVPMAAQPAVASGKLARVVPAGWTWGGSAAR